MSPSASAGRAQSSQPRQDRAAQQAPGVEPGVSHWPARATDGDPRRSVRAVACWPAARESMAYAAGRTRSRRAGCHPVESSRALARRCPAEARIVWRDGDGRSRTQRGYRARQGQPRLAEPGAQSSKLGEQRSGVGRERVWLRQCCRLRRFEVTRSMARSDSRTEGRTAP